MRAYARAVALFAFVTLAAPQAGAQTSPTGDLQFSIPGTQRAPDRLLQPAGENSLTDLPATAGRPPSAPDGPPPPGAATEPPSDPPRLPQPPRLPGDPLAFPGVRQ